MWDVMPANRDTYQFVSGPFGQCFVFICRVPNYDSPTRAAKKAKQTPTKSVPTPKPPPATLKEPPAAAKAPPVAAEIPKEIVVDEENTEVQVLGADDLQAELMSVYQGTQDNDATSGKKKSPNLPETTKLFLRPHFKEKVWRLIKFVSSDKQLAQMATYYLKTSALASGKFTKAGKLSPSGAQWVENYADTLSKILNDFRSSCQNNLKKVCFSYMKAKKVSKMPKIDEFLKIIARDPDLDKELFIWWWTEFMPKASGSSRLWNKQVYCFGTLSSMAPPSTPNEPYITASTEAFGVLVLENCASRWPALLGVDKEGKAGVIQYTKRDMPDKKGSNRISTTRNPEFMGKYTRSDLGQKKFGGWSKEGLQRFAELCKIAKEGRQKETTEALETDVLVMIRDENEIQGSNWTEHSNIQKGVIPEGGEENEIDGLFELDEIGFIEEV
jgi:hypothetical protein